ncbi:extracellular solute-binding protein [Paenibacillus chungangensis]|uniref:Extracellular solute-binding protein n=1 Tax=Paenibacillus chungangensis TaxID=696535 RepID=A0ABW3HSC4_9BACL
MKKLISLMMIMVLVVVTAACSGSDSGKETNKGSDKPQATNSGGSNSGDKEKTDEGAKNVLDGDKPTLRQLQPFNHFDPNNDYVAKFLEEKTGYKVKYDMLPEEMFNEKLNLLMANKEPYDFMKLGKDQFYNLVEAGALEPLDELLEQYGDNLKAGINEETWKAATVDGKIYGVPEGGTGLSASTNLVIRKDWLDELGLEIPTNRDELYNVLKTIKEKKNVIPLSGYKSIFPEIATTFDIPTLSSNAFAWGELNGELIQQAQHPKMKDYLAFMNKLYDEGLIDSEWPINTGSKVIEKFTSGKAAIMSVAWWSSPSIVSALAKNFPDAKLETLPYLTGDSGKPSVGAGAGISYYIAIPKWAKNKEHAMNLINMKLEENLFKELVIGEEGVHHKVEDGKYYPILPKFNDDLNNASHFLTGTDQRVYEDYWQARVRKDPVLQGYYEQFQQQAEGNFVVDPMSKAKPIESVSKYTQSLMQFSEDTYMKYIGGSDSLDTFDSYLAQWEANGGKEMVEDAREWYNSQK